MGDFKKPTILFSPFPLLFYLMIRSNHRGEAKTSEADCLPISSPALFFQRCSLWPHKGAEEEERLDFLWQKTTLLDILTKVVEDEVTTVWRRRRVEKCEQYCLLKLKIPWNDTTDLACALIEEAECGLKWRGEKVELKQEPVKPIASKLSTIPFFF